jgi:hypothetical protein
MPRLRWHAHLPGPFSVSGNVIPHSKRGRARSRGPSIGAAWNQSNREAAAALGRFNRSVPTWQQTTGHSGFRVFAAVMAVLLYSGLALTVLPFLACVLLAADIMLYMRARSDAPSFVALRRGALPWLRAFPVIWHTTLGDTHA